MSDAQATRGPNHDFEQQVEDELEAQLAERDKDNPYMVGGVNYAPEVLYRCVNSLDDARKFLLEGLKVHEMTPEDAASKSGVEVEAIYDTLEKRPKSLAAMLAALGAAGVQAVTVPLELLGE